MIPTTADSQLFVTLAPQPRLSGVHVIFGQVISGMDVVAKIQGADVVTRVTAKAVSMQGRTIGAPDSARRARSDIHL